MTSPQQALHNRLVELSKRDVHPRINGQIVQAYLDAGGEDATWGDLPADVQKLIVENEQLPVQS